MVIHQITHVEDTHLDRHIHLEAQHTVVGEMVGQEVLHIHLQHLEHHTEVHRLLMDQDEVDLHILDLHDLLRIHHLQEHHQEVRIHQYHHEVVIHQVIEVDTAEEAEVVLVEVEVLVEGVEVILEEAEAVEEANILM